eukprot:gnl/MRDRNA2_/MRDRNA2_74345_c0_seq2.p1 gnl/MRDRNA2_/MRDRNA2_74345_c0~~gnl/MRDRNA2_/MRDRNA2_74345_c0_seq2.p1  ORF type:complete len:156 (+),score=28.52 gnl/MRDRNA2_/MRDRNA2_74345_c0_seq2:191-658(+)
MPMKDQGTGDERKEQLREQLHVFRKRASNSKHLSLKLDDETQGLFKQLNDICKEIRSGSGSAKHFAIKPKVGGALVFWHWVRMDAAIPWERTSLREEHGDHWHTWCPPFFNGGDQERFVNVFFGHFSTGVHIRNVENSEESTFKVASILSSEGEL